MALIVRTPCNIVYPYILPFFGKICNNNAWHNIIGVQVVVDQEWFTCEAAPIAIGETWYTVIR